MRRGLRAQLTLTIASIVLVTVAVISLIMNITINKGFDKYISEQQKVRSEDIVKNLSSQYDRLSGQWDISYIHGVGMYALYEGYVIRVTDSDGNIIWDAENHDMSLCNQIMGEITHRMDEKRPELHGGITTADFDLELHEKTIGKVRIKTYGPYFLSENDFRFLRVINIVLLVIGLLSLAGPFFTARLLAKRISKPIIKTAHIAAQISEGNYKTRLEDKAHVKELDELVAAVNHMAVALDTQESIRKQMTTDVAHELRTPLTAISSHLEAMIEGVWEPTPARLQSCYEEICRLSGLVSDLEKLTQMENEMVLNKTQVDLLELAQTVGINFESESLKKKIKLTASGDACIVQADRDRLIQMLSNLVSNAVKFTNKNGSVTITVKNTPDSGIITVEDNGIGIPKDELPFIFERFYRTDKSRSRKTGGAGIGLTIAKTIVLAHEGKIEADSTLGQGSRFIVTLPKNE
jgi:two-component system sensor histidine kinase BaeS